MNDTPQDYMDIAALAWQVVKGSSDPPLPGCMVDHQHRFVFKVESVQKSGIKEDDFDRAAAELIALPREEWAAWYQGFATRAEDSYTGLNLWQLRELRKKWDVPPIGIAPATELPEIAAPTDEPHPAFIEMPIYNELHQQAASVAVLENGYEEEN